MKKTGLITLGLLVAMISQQVAAEVRTWTGSNGSRLEAEFVKEVGGKVVLCSAALADNQQYYVLNHTAPEI